MQFETVEGDALNDVDFIQKRGTLVWNDGDTSHRMISIELVSDGTSRFGMIFKHMFVRLTNNSGTTQLEPRASISGVYLVDDAAATGFLSFAPSYVDPVLKTVRGGPVVQRVREGVDHNVTFTVVRSGGNQGNMSVRYRSVDSSAREGVHFRGTSGRLVWPEGDNSDRTISVQILDNNDFAPFVDLRTFSLILEDVMLSNGALSTPAYQGPPSVYAQVLIEEDDGFGLLGFEKTQLAVDEDVGHINISVVRRAGSDGAVSVMFAATSASASHLAADASLPTACRQTPPGLQMMEAVAGQARAVHCNGGAEDDAHSASIFFWDYSTQLWDRKCVETPVSDARNRLVDSFGTVSLTKPFPAASYARLAATNTLPSAFDYSMSAFIAEAANATVNVCGSIRVATVTCSGNCPCDVGEVGKSNGSFTDGSVVYGTNSNCRWLIEAPGNDISVGFDAFDTESPHDFVTISECDSADCNTETLLATLSGAVGAGAEYMSSTGYMLVTFTSDYSVEKSGFDLHWTVRRNGQNVECNSSIGVGGGSGDATGVSMEASWQPIALPLQQKVVLIDWNNKNLAWCGTCKDQSEWRDSDGQSCEDYVNLGYCENGAEGSSWHWSWGPFWYYSVDGIDASQACCECKSWFGGGSGTGLSISTQTR